MTYEIWSEGFAATGQSGTAHRHGAAEGETFQEACEAFAQADTAFADYFSAGKLTYWGCKLFDNESDARKRYG